MALLLDLAAIRCFVCVIVLQLTMKYIKVNIIVAVFDHSVLVFNYLLFAFEWKNIKSYYLKLTVEG